MLARIQNDLFDLGADLCVPEASTGERQALRITDTHVARLEAEIDELNGELQPLRSFVLPGGNPASAQLHVARTIARRAERRILRLAAQPTELVNDAAIRYVNRLSDFLFVASRYLNDRGRADLLWEPGRNS
jgi:cob(I)alamin adenosyltransferase